MNNMKDLFVPYELAVKLKEKGFNEPCMYMSDRPGQYFVVWDYKWFSNSNIPRHYNKETVSAPFYQQATDWLRQNYDLHLRIDLLKSGWAWNWTNLGKWNHHYPLEQEYFDSYYSALQSGIEKALELI